MPHVIGTVGYHDRVWESKRESELLHKDLPESLQAVSDALQKNRQCQRMLRNLLLQVELKQRENKEMYRRACTLLDFEGFCKRKFSGFSMELGNPSVKLISTKPHTSITNGEVSTHSRIAPPVSYALLYPVRCQAYQQFSLILSPASSCSVCCYTEAFDLLQLWILVSGCTARRAEGERTSAQCRC